MNTYLAIITTVLVLTQIIRLIQNAIQIRRQNILFKEQLGHLADTEVTAEDFAIQRKAYRLVVEYLEDRAAEKAEASSPTEEGEMSIFGKNCGYTGTPCPSCGRYRLERYENGNEVCEKCNWCPQLNRYVEVDELFPAEEDYHNA